MSKYEVMGGSSGVKADALTQVLLRGPGSPSPLALKWDAAACLKHALTPWLGTALRRGAGLCSAASDNADASPG